MSLELDDETREQLGLRNPWEELLVAFDVVNAARQDSLRVSRRASHVTYEKTEKYRDAHRRAALAYYHRNKKNPRVRVRGAA